MTPEVSIGGFGGALQERRGVGRSRRKKGSTERGISLAPGNCWEGHRLEGVSEAGWTGGLTGGRE